MTDIVAFIEARLAEDAQRWKTIWRFKVGDKSVDGWWDLGGTFGYAVNDIIDTTRGGREVAAKRRVLSRHCPGVAQWEHMPIPCAGCRGCPVGKSGFLYFTKDINECPELRDLASAYADHPDFDPAWRIDG